ncbi:hypothetical protein SAMN05428946_2687 [Edaphobacillus lindanitolerans]|uniref:Uncharacterized protein n=1 Tax=Edaphobacillus lindanitolerans TaxID=550447 RepID=A0A1U7PQL1_9BACI|nr:hypothetical protein SAMN05428946_2687 [Edaphobacillus lindanitolerans]
MFGLTLHELHPKPILPGFSFQPKTEHTFQKECF